ncbi:unnamed protein product, partial [Polarella glacialis]
MVRHDSRSRSRGQGSKVQPSASPSGAVEEWILRNQSLLSKDAEIILRNMSPGDQRQVIDAGDLPTTDSPVWEITARVTKTGRSRTVAAQAPPPRKLAKSGMEEGRWNNQRAKNESAASEGRALYVRGIPPEWTPEELTTFFTEQGEVEGVNLLPRKQGQRALAAFVNFESHEETLDAAKARRC